MKLLVQGDDYGMTFGCADGTCRAAAEGILTATGLFVNLDSSAYAAERIKSFPHISVGLDINFFAGRCCADPAQVPHLINEKGEFPLSSERKKQMRDYMANVASHNKKADGRSEFGMYFPLDDPFPFDETLIEVRAQVSRYEELLGHKPAYIQGHSYLTDSLVKAMKLVAKEKELIYTLDFWANKKIHMYDHDWLLKDGFTLEKQLATDVEQLVYDQLETLAQYDRALIVCHPGYLDNDLFSRSSYTVIRVKDLAMLTSPRIRRKLEELGVELVNYQTL